MSFQEKFNRVKGLEITELVELANQANSNFVRVARENGIPDEIGALATAGMIFLFAGVDNEVNRGEILVYQIVTGHTSITDEKFLETAANARTENGLKNIFAAVLVCIKKVPELQKYLETIALAVIRVDDQISDMEVKLFEALFEN